MQHPEHVYYAAMFLIALPAAWFLKNRVALLVFAVWAIGQTAYLIGLPEPQTQFLIYGVALVLGVCIAQTLPCLFSAVLFAPLCMVCAADLTGTIGPVEAWWDIYWLAMLQVLSLPFCMPFSAYRKAIGRIINKLRGRAMFRALHVA